MVHRERTRRFGRRTGPRKALIRGLVGSLVENGRITTTLAKAKELRRHVERAVTLGKKGTLHARRLLLSRYPQPKTVQTIVAHWSPQFKTRPGGYTRILRLGRRPGDSAEMAIIEFLDFETIRGQSEKPQTKKASKKEAPAGAEKAAPRKTKKAKTA